MINLCPKRIFLWVLIEFKTLWSILAFHSWFHPFYTATCFHQRGRHFPNLHCAGLRHIYIYKTKMGVRESEHLYRLFYSHVSNPKCLIFFLQRHFLLCETGDPEKGEDWARCQVHFSSGQEEGCGSQGDGAAVWAGQREDSLFPRRLWKEERGGAHHRAVSFHHPARGPESHIIWCRTAAKEVLELKKKEKTPTLLQHHS